TVLSEFRRGKSVDNRAHRSNRSGESSDERGFVRAQASHSDSHGGDAGVETDQFAQWVRVPALVGHALESGAGAGAALADPDDLAATDRHLAGAETREAHPVGPRSTAHRAVVDARGLAHGRG